MLLEADAEARSSLPTDRATPARRATISAAVGIASRQIRRIDERVNELRRMLQDLQHRVATYRKWTDQIDQRARGGQAVGDSSDLG